MSENLNLDRAHDNYENIDDDQLPVKLPEYVFVLPDKSEVHDDEMKMTPQFWMTIHWSNLMNRQVNLKRLLRR